jgi:hypothetical protein
MGKEVKLTRGLVAIIDDEDHEMVSAYKWHARKSRNTFYARASDGTLMHRLIIGAGKGEITDHEDRNGLNNRRSNLRITNHVGNVVNYPGRNKHGYKGIMFDPRCKSKPWQAMCRHNGKNVTAGMYATQELAAMAYDKLARELHGPTAYVNFPAALEANRE